MLYVKLNNAMVQSHYLVKNNFKKKSHHNKVFYKYFIELLQIRDGCHLMGRDKVEHSTPAS